MLKIQVPASTANLGPGYDSIGLAVNLFLSLQVEIDDKWVMEIDSESLSHLPKDESNFVIQVAMKTANKYGKKLPPCKIKMKSDIPLARGLGSSAAAIIAGIELANEVGELNLTDNEKFQIASEMEGHPDNVGPCLFGGLVIGWQQGSEVDAVVYRELSLDLIACVPKTELLTKESRAVLPTEWPFTTAVTAGGIGNVLVAALLTGNYPLAGKMMKNDLYHQPYRRKLVPHMEIIEDVALKSSAFGVALSGAGPTVMCFCEQGKGDTLIQHLSKVDIPDMAYYKLKVDTSGSRVRIESLVKEC